MSLMMEIARVWVQYRTFRTTLDELGHYSDRELAELRIARGDVARIAYEEAERRAAAYAAEHPPAPRRAGAWRRLIAAR